MSEQTVDNKELSIKSECKQEALSMRIDFQLNNENDS
jgi:hypothetical protein